MRALAAIACFSIASAAMAVVRIGIGWSISRFDGSSFHVSESGSFGTHERGHYAFGSDFPDGAVEYKATAFENEQRLDYHIRAVEGSWGYSKTEIAAEAVASDTVTITGLPISTPVPVMLEVTWYYEMVVVPNLVGNQSLFARGNLGAHSFSQTISTADHHLYPGTTVHREYITLMAGHPYTLNGQVDLGPGNKVIGAFGAQYVNEARARLQQFIRIRPAFGAGLQSASGTNYYLPPRNVLGLP